jgi:non-homologous end joining protein Ku
MVKGYEFARGQYVLFSPEELKALEEAGTHTAEITEFVPIESIDPVYFDKAYYLAPDKGAPSLTRCLRGRSPTPGAARSGAGRRAASSTSW